MLIIASKVITQCPSNWISLLLSCTSGLLVLCSVRPWSNSQVWFSRTGLLIMMQHFVWKLWQMQVTSCTWWVCINHNIFYCNYYNCKNLRTDLVILLVFIFLMPYLVLQQTNIHFNIKSVTRHLHMGGGCPGRVKVVTASREDK